MSEKPQIRHLESHHHHDIPEGRSSDGSSLYRTRSGRSGTGEVAVEKGQAALLTNPLLGKTEADLLHDVDAYVERTGLHHIRDLLYKGALIAQDRENAERLPQLTEEEKQYFREEKTHRFKQSKTLYWTVFMCSMAAVVQGMDQSVTNGANLFWPQQFGVGGDSTRDTLLLGLTAAAPYLSSAFLSCWLTYPLNKYFGRRGAIFISTTCAFLGCIWNGVTNSWQHLFVSRLFLGLGIGPKSATVPMFAAEIAPANIRGALTLQWQTWTAFGIMLGTVSSLVFYNVPDPSGITGLNWRLMLGSAMLPCIPVMAQVYLIPESPRWLMTKGRHEEAWQAYRKLRRSDIQAATELFYTAECLAAEAEYSESEKRSQIAQMLTIKRNLRAFRASTVVMFMQQFCGINAIAYYSSTIFTNAGQDDITALLGSFGYGAINWVFSYPAFFTIDHFGRRSLLLFTLPFLSLFMFVAGSGFWLSSNDAQLAMVTTGIYIFAAFYGPGAGPVPFPYSAEVYPIQVRELGMSWATAVTWVKRFESAFVASFADLSIVRLCFVCQFFNFLNALFFPLQLRSWTSAGAFYWFGGWNAVLWVLVLLFVPETKLRTLEELDEVFSMSTKRQVAYGLSSPAYWFKKYILRQDIYRSELSPSSHSDFHPHEEKSAPRIDHREKV
ncbi:hypothetical protein JCM11251_007008 [Rhodosporidiobolus azoricus]